MVLWSSPPICRGEESDPRLEAIAIGLEAIAIGLEAIASGSDCESETPVWLVHRPRKRAPPSAETEGREGEAREGPDLHGVLWPAVGRSQVKGDV